MKRIFNEDSFGPICPSNWEEIADYLNDKVEEMGIEGDFEAQAKLWDDFCMHRLPDAPTDEYKEA